MKIKRFYAKTMRGALQQVRDEQGPESVILSNRAVEDGVEVVAAVDYDEALFHQSFGQSASASDTPDKVANHESPASSNPASEEFDVDVPIAILKEPVAEPDAYAQPTLSELSQELKAIRAMMQHELSHLSYNDLQRRHPGMAAVIRRLNLLGLDPQIIESLVGAIPNNTPGERAWRTALALLAKRIPMASTDRCATGGTYALVGPTGVGKTTCIAKIAARYALLHGPDRVGLVTTDSVSIGAQEQLFRIGKILGVPVRLAPNDEALHSTLEQLEAKQLILIDTPGYGQRNPRLMEQLDRLTHCASPIQTLLTLSANIQTDCLKQAIEAFGCIDLAGAIITKLDEATSLGGLLSSIINADLKICYVTDGQRIPEDIHPGAKFRAELVSRAVELTKQCAQKQSAGRAKEEERLSSFVHQAVING